MASSARIDELRKKFEENPRRYFAPLANEYRKAGDVQRAIELCREHLPQQPGHMSGHIVYGQALFEAGEFDESRQVFEEALRLDPENLIALRHLGDIARDHGDVASAREWYQRVLDADPRNEEIAAQIASLSSAAPAGIGAAEGPVDESADLASLAPDADLAADIAAGVVEPPATKEAAADAGFERTPARAADHRAAESAADAPQALDLDLDAMAGAPSGASTGTGMEDRPLGLESIGGAAADDAQGAVAESVVIREELEVTEVVGTTADDTSFGDVDLDADVGERRGESAAVLDDALQDGGMAPTPAGGFDTAAATRSEGGADFSDFALADAPPEPATPAARTEAESVPAGATAHGEAAEPPPPPSTTPAGHGMEGEGYSLGRLSGLESMEFVPPEAEKATAGAFDDPTFGRTLREDAAASSAATPAAFVTETMAELYLQQGFRDEALGVYRQLLEQHPDDSNLRDRVAQLEQGSSSSVGAAAVSEAVVEAARQRGAAHPERSVRTFFASLAARRAPVRRPNANVGDSGSASGTGGATPGDAESRASDAYVEAIGEGYDEPTGSDARGSSAAVAPPRFDEFGFPDISESAAPSNAGASVEVSELPESAGIEPATLDYLAHEGADASVADAAATPGPVDTLFDGAAVSTRDEAAAATLADAFGAATPSAAGPRAATGGARRVPTPGAGPTPARDPRTPATRPAARELSLDDVFRETPRRGGSVRREGTPSFSFDQFFAEGSTGGSSAPPRSSSTPASGGASASGDAAPQGEEAASADIEQFNAWLEGLKKK